MSVQSTLSETNTNKENEKLNIKETRQGRESSRKWQKRAEETEEECETRLAKIRSRYHQKKANESAEQQIERNVQNANNIRNKHALETEEQRNKRNSQNVSNMCKKRGSNILQNTVNIVEDDELENNLERVDHELLNKFRDNISKFENKEYKTCEERFPSIDLFREEKSNSGSLVAESK
ncbi:19471_t:CDS:2 [Dentiscutata erythropus]|uniref:19471_t:CDS:1 n=1 Tax=Dentiscutata erythropus TaxID=1348616 RepID=A0A9N8W6D7_9GLOM|nr:19471_t:CDS:2 [Dentiscutata erythropus]